MTQTTSNIELLPTAAVLPIVTDEHGTQATLVYDSGAMAGVITIVSARIVGGIGVLHLTPDIIEGIEKLVEEFNETVGPEYA